MEWENEREQRDDSAVLTLVAEENSSRDKSPELKYLRKAEPVEQRGERVTKLISSYYCVNQDRLVSEVAEEWQLLPEMEYLALVDEESVPTGFLNREEFFASLGKQYGVEILGKKKVSTLCDTRYGICKARTGIFQVSDLQGTISRETGDVPTLVVSEHGYFRGLFTTRDLLIYLSEITRRDILMAQGLQNRIVKEGAFCRGSRFELTSGARMAKGVGGDFHFARQMENERLFWALCDVSGKGVSASLVTTFLWGVISAFPLKKGPSRLVRLLNDRLIKAFSHERFVTGVFCDFNAKTGEAVIIDMGHGHLYLLRGTTLLQVPTVEGNLPLGVVPELNPEVKKLRMKPGDVLIALSDGLIEQTNLSGEEYPVERITRLIQEKGAKTLEDFDKSLMQDFDDFRGLQTQHDDTSFTFLRYLSGEE